MDEECSICCNRKPRRDLFRCPTCKVRYCSLNCYQAPDHTNSCIEEKEKQATNQAFLELRGLDRPEKNIDTASESTGTPRAEALVNSEEEIQITSEMKQNVRENAEINDLLADEETRKTLKYISGLNENALGCIQKSYDEQAPFRMLMDKFLDIYAEGKPVK